MLHQKRRICFGLAVVCLTIGSVVEAWCAERILFVGTYTRGTESKGIYVYRFDEETGKLTPVAVTEGLENPSFLALHPNGKMVYSSDEVDSFDGEPTGAVSALAIADATGELSLVNRQAAGGTSPCHLTVDPSGKHVLVVGYGSGTVAVLPLDDEGKLQPVSQRLEHRGSSVNKERQSSPHPHQIVLDRSGRFALVPDLGLDQVVQYRFDQEKGRLTPNQRPFVATNPGAGPRHVAIHPDGKRAFAINELDLTVMAYELDGEGGTLKELSTVSALAEGVSRDGVSGAEIAVHPNGKFLYASLRGVDEIVVFEIGAGGELTFVERVPTGGKTPRNFTLDPSGKWLLVGNQNSGTITVFRISDDGRLTAKDQTAKVPAPVCLLFRDAN
jgi:6-phosphogluconolactonase